MVFQSFITGQRSKVHMIRMYGFLWKKWPVRIQESNTHFSSLKISLLPVIGAWSITSIITTQLLLTLTMNSNPLIRLALLANELLIWKVEEILKPMILYLILKPSKKSTASMVKVQSLQD